MKKAFLLMLNMIVMAVGLIGHKYFKPLDGPGMERDSTDLSALEDSVTIGDSLNVVADVAAQKQDMEAVRAFVEQFYKDWGMENLLEYAIRNSTSRPVS